MSRASAVTQFLIDITRGPLRDAYAANPVGVLSGSPLDERMRGAVREQDVGALWLAGAHPMALLYFARSIGWANERYYGCLAEAELRRGAPAEADLQAAHGPSRTHR